MRRPSGAQVQIPPTQILSAQTRQAQSFLSYLSQCASAEQQMLQTPLHVQPLQYMVLASAIPAVVLFCPARAVTYYMEEIVQQISSKHSLYLSLSL